MPNHELFLCVHLRHLREKNKVSFLISVNDFYRHNSPKIPPFSFSRPSSIDQVWVEHG